MRNEGWPELLAAWVDRVRDQPFRWGEWDCALAAADMVEAITGTDPLEGLRWSDARGAARQLEIEGGIEAAVTHRMGQPIDPREAMRGDLVLLTNVELEGLRKEVLGVCLGAVAAAPAADGLAFVPMPRALKAWAVR